MEGGIAHFGLWSEGRKNIFNPVFQEGIDEHVDIIAISSQVPQPLLCIQYSWGT